MVSDEKIKGIIDDYFTYDEPTTALDWSGEFEKSLKLVVSDILCIKKGIRILDNRYRLTEEYWKFFMVADKFIERHPELVSQYEVMLRV